jgi:Fe-S oxidoreductase
MNPIGMTILLTVTLAAFAYSATRRWRLMRIARRPENRADQIGRRLAGVFEFAFAQQRMPRYPLAGWAHIVVFFGFLVLLLNSLILWGRGYVADFDFWLFGLHQPLGVIYAFLRDIFTFLVLVGVLVFFYYRIIARLKRLTLNAEGLLILGIIFAMMIADLIYEGVEVIHRGGQFHAAMPFGSLAARLLVPLSPGAQGVLWHVGFWAHSALVLLFLNLLPYGKHFHVLTVLPNVFARALTPRGRLAPIADIEGRLEREETLGVKRVQDFSWKDVLDLYTCTECGRCTDQCPATNTGKVLSPKHLSIDLRDHLYHRQDELLVGRSGPATGREGEAGPPADEQDLLVPATINPEVLWACTTCAACEQECPVFITYIDKIVDLRRYLVMERGEFPGQLQTAFKGLETVGNPYSFPNEQRAEWAAGLDVPLMAEQSDVDYLYWVGCAASFDDRSRKIARALAQLLKTAGVSFAILGPEETCNGDPARRAGNEFLFQMLARQNVETLSRYNVKKIVAACPHCYNTLENEYPDFGGHYQVVHHSELLADLVRAGRLVPRRRIEARVTYHDACYLGRHNDVYDPPRDVLRAIPGLRVFEAVQSRDRGMCCGAGGAQMWKEEEAGHARVNHTRVRQLMSALPDGSKGCTIASACPFCKTMLSDGLADQGLEGVGQLDIAELLWQAVQGEAPAPNPADTAGATT